ncbi:hypothetical protein ACFFHM_11250 [Halalkalibacter kiskunsagensis]|uniref:Uncharacterized protein n=1 Tax=Halalkalibacter kiskunsagensis TaxID=1548599 RepID=A0ABV6KDK7_9BACI
MADMIVYVNATIEQPIQTIEKVSTNKLTPFAFNLNQISISS